MPLLLLSLTFAWLLFQNLQPASAQGSIQAPPFLELDSVDPGSIGHVPLLVISATNAPPIMVTPTNLNVIVIGGSQSYAILTPTTNATLQLSVSTTDTNGIELAVYSSQNLFTFIAGDSSVLDHTNVASVTFQAVAHVTYYIQLTGVGMITFNYGLGIPPTFTQTQSSQAIPAGCPVTFGATASGIPTPTFQWQFKDTDIPGATNSTYTIGAAAAGNVGNYRVKSINAFGTITSPEANLTVVPVNIGTPSLDTNQSFHFTLTGLAGQAYAIQASTDLTNWATAFTGTANSSGSLAFTDSQVPNNVARYFRARAVCN